MQSGGMEQRNIAAQKSDQLGAELSTMILVGAHEVSHFVKKEQFTGLLLSDRYAPFVMESQTIGPAREIALSEEWIVNPFIIGDDRQPGRGLGERQSLCWHLGLKSIFNGVGLLGFSGLGHVNHGQSHADVNPSRCVLQ